jgi:hypothetical protein
LLLTLRVELLVELERLDVAGATLFTDELLDCCETLRFELLLETLRVELLPELATLRLELLPELATLRLEVEPAETLRFEVEPAETLRLAVDPVALRPSFEAVPADLEAILLDVRVTLRLEFEPNEAVRLAVVLRLRFLSHPPSLILRLGL